MRWLALPAAGLLMVGCGGGDPQDPGGDEGTTPVAGCTEGRLPAGALSQICFPTSWNGDLVLYAHGYVAPSEPLALPADGLGGVSISAAVTGLGYGFATTSYRANGLVVNQGVEDLAELIAEVRRQVKPDPTRVFVVGVSEGGLVAALAIERHSDLITGALPACGPVGDFARQLDYFGDARVALDYFFPGLLPGTAIDIPDELRDGWDATFEPAVVDALTADPDATAQLLAVTGIPAPADPAAAAPVIAGVLWYNVFATEDAAARLGGQPYDNGDRVYAGSTDDAALNRGVARFVADPAARAALAGYRPTGELPGRVITLHTTGDPIVPFFHEALYAGLVASAGQSGRLEQRRVDRPGHCAFTPAELVDAFTALVQPAAAARAVATGP